MTRTVSAELVLLAALAATFGYLIHSSEVERQTRNERMNDALQDLQRELDRHQHDPR